MRPVSIAALIGCLLIHEGCAPKQEPQMFKDYADARGAASRAMFRQDLETIRAAFEQFPDLKNEDRAFPWVIDAVNQGSAPTVELLVNLGCDINETKDMGCTSAITSAIPDHIELLPGLLKQGADPNLPRARAILAAINAGERRLEVVKLLVEHGADVNQAFDLYGNEDALFTAVEFAEPYPDVVAYLRSKGAKTVDELRAEGKLPAASSGPGDHTGEERSFPEQAVAWFNENMGPVDPAALTEIVPSDLPITIHVIPSSGERPFVTLFTSGMSERPMNVPDGESLYAFAELFIQLPKDWKYQDLQNPQWNWPILWLRRIARLPHDGETWLGGPVTIIAEDEAPMPIAPGVPFTSMLVLAEHHFQTDQGATLQLYRLTPLHTDERELEIRSGLPALMNAFDRNSTPFIVDVKRRSVALAR